MPAAPGRYLPLSLPRRWIADLLYFARQVPTVPVERTMQLGLVRPARAQACVSWPAVFLKVFDMAAQRHPELRRAWIQYPWPRLYEHPHSIFSIAIERDFAGEPAVFFGHLSNPHTRSLQGIDRELRRFKEDPIQSHGLFRRTIRFAKLPLHLRRFAWWTSLHWSGPKRAKRLGTAGLSVYASLGASSLHPLSPLSFALNYGVIDEAGRMAVRLIYDHRVTDGATVARALATMEEFITGPVLEELRSLTSQAVVPLAQSA